jgi:hypothetical protein
MSELGQIVARRVVVDELAPVIARGRIGVAEDVCSMASAANS